MPVDVNRPGPWTHRNLTARGTRFHVALAGPEAPSGSGLLTLLIHGFPECWWTWRHVIPALAQAGHRVAALDLRGLEHERQRGRGGCGAAAARASACR